MPTQAQSLPETPLGAPPFGAFELPKAFLEPALRSLRFANTLLDTLFYDTRVLAADLLWRGEIVSTQTSPVSLGTGFAEPGFGRIDLGALTDPEGSILIVDAAKAPFITRFDRADAFIDHLTSSARDIQTVTMTGVGGSALGSAAFAWNVSQALGQRVAAIVPGYGVADAVSQSLGGWFGFGVGDALAEATQHGLAQAAPRTARVGTALVHSTPGHTEADRGAPDFHTGCPASDVLHGLLLHAPGLRNLVGHGKGALAIGNALRSLPGTTTRRCHVITFGCAIDESIPAASYTQFLGLIDVLGALNAWGRKAEYRPFAHHGTNSAIPFSLPVALLSRLATASAPPIINAPRALTAPAVLSLVKISPERADAG
jgi:hypothetical protein